MLRLNSIHHPDGVTVVVEGQIVSEWGAFLARECGAMLEEGRRVSLDLSAVSNVDPAGIASVQRLLGRSVTLVKCPPLLEELLLDGGDEDENG